MRWVRWSLVDVFIDCHKQGMGVLAVEGEKALDKSLMQRKTYLYDYSIRVHWGKRKRIFGIRHTRVIGMPILTSEHYNGVQKNAGILFIQLPISEISLWILPYVVKLRSHNNVT